MLFLKDTIYLFLVVVMATFVKMLVDLPENSQQLLIEYPSHLA